jgi:ABC-type nitrate/sulfonate/bicarbonate transport system substrate-binding protein
MTQQHNTTAQDIVWYSRCPVPTPFSVALKKGWLQQAVGQATGCEQAIFKSLAESRDETIRAAHFTHAHVDVLRHGGNIPPLWARSLDADTRLIGVSWVTMRQQVQVMPDSGIHTPADLKGKRILIQRNDNTSVDYWRASTLRTYEAALASAGLTFDDVTLVEHVSHVGKHRPDAALSADGSLWTADRSFLRRRELLLPLVRGEVDAIATQAHYGVEFEGLIGVRTIFDRSLSANRSDRVNNDTPDVLTVSASLLEKRPDIVDQVLLQLFKARDWAKTHRAEVIQLMAQEFKTSETLVEQSWGDDLFEGLDLNLSDDNIAALQSQHDFLLKHGFISRPVDIQAWIDRQPLERALALYANTAAA